MPDLFDFHSFPLLETPRLRLRKITAADVEAIFAIRGDYEVTRYNIGAAYPDLAHAQQLIDSMREAYITKQELRWGITLTAQGDRIIGMVGYNEWLRQDFRASVGFDLARAYWGRGIMTEALRAILHFGFDRMGLNRIEADCSALNIASTAVLEKVGFLLEGRQREQYYEDGQFYDLLLFGLLRRDFRSG